MRRRKVDLPWQAETLEARYLLTLAPAVDYALVDGQQPTDIATGDLNGDGLVDLVTAAGSRLQILFGSGNGAFQPAQSIAVAAGMRSVALADLNTDGRPDVVATSAAWNGTANEGFINVLINRGRDAGGNVTFETLRRFSTGNNTTPGPLVVGDLNGDGRLDVAVGQIGGQNVTVLMGSGDGHLATGRQFVAGSDHSSIAVGDFDSDGRLDLVTSNRRNYSVSVLLNNGNDAGPNVTFQPARVTWISGIAEGVAVGDFNADGRLDLAATASVPIYGYYGGYYGATGYVNVLLGNGNGTFTLASTNFVNNNRVGEVALADFNGDGHLDVVTPDGLQATPFVDPTVLLGRGDGTFDPPYHFDAGLGPIGVVATDLNGDLTPDVGVANFTAASVSVLLNDNSWPALRAPLVSINDVWITEGDTGTRNAVFTVRAARNLFDYVELDRLESEFGVQFISVAQPTENTPAGRMQRRMLASMASFYTEQQSIDVKVGIERRVESGLFPSRPPYGYRNVRIDGRSIVEVHPENAHNIRRIFELYGYHSHTLDTLPNALLAEGIEYLPSTPIVGRSKLYAILTDRSYIGEIKFRGQWYPVNRETTRLADASHLRHAPGRGRRIS